MAKSAWSIAPLDELIDRSKLIKRQAASDQETMPERTRLRLMQMLYLALWSTAPVSDIVSALRSADQASTTLGQLREGTGSAAFERPRVAVPSVVPARTIPRRVSNHLLVAALTVSACLAPYTLYHPAHQDRTPVAIVAAQDIERAAVVAPQPQAASIADDLALPQHVTLTSQEVGVFTRYHTLVEGESLADVAQQYGVSVAAVYWSNDLQSSSLLQSGTELRIPRLSGIPYVVQQDDTVERIAEQYQVVPDAILLLHENHLDAGSPLPVGQEIFIPGAVPVYPDGFLEQVGGEAGIAQMRAVIAGSVHDNDTNLRTGPGISYERIAYLDAGMALEPIARFEDWVKVHSEQFGQGWIRADMLALSDTALADLPQTTDFPPPPPRWVWPTYGQMTSPFGWRTQPSRSFHNGLDIANRAGTPIVAARAGTVFEAGWCSGFGYCVKIDHGGGVSTIYGHMLRKPFVVAGERVDAGQRIGLMGSTFDRAGGGYSTGVHLHFTVKVNGQVVNPLKYLP